MDTELNLSEIEEAERLTALLLKQLRQEINASELQELNNRIAKDPSYKLVYDQINNEEQLLADLLSLQQIDKKGWWQKISEQTVAAVKPVPFFHRRRTWVAAALVLIVTGITWWSVAKRSPKRANETNVPAIANKLPGGNKATLTLSNGAVINLGNAANGAVAEEGNATVIKLNDGELKYESTNGQSAIDNRQSTTGNGQPVGRQKSEGAYNILSTPRGGQYQLVLPDGSRVWLNAASSITFPTHFARNERRVAITGEAYFDVSALPLTPSGGRGNKTPFIVSINAPSGESVAEVEVLGTQFNINAYSDEEAIKTTLLKGKVKIFVTSDANNNKTTTPGTRNAKLLSSGQQAQIPVPATGTGTPDVIKVIDQANTEIAVAWKNGFHSFKNADIRTIMRMLGRWYNIEVGYEGNIPNYKFTGSIPRTEKMSAVLHMLEYAGVHFRLQENKITVIP